ncbi:MerR family transcriptional regulator, partial [Staphylococcus aureus]
SLDYEVSRVARSKIPINRGDLSRFFK